MKKLLTLLLILLMVFTMVGCNTKENTPIVQELEQQEVIEEAEIVGGYVDVEDGTLTDELKEQVDEELKRMMIHIYNVSVEASKKYNLGYDLVSGANIAGFERVAEAMYKQVK